MLCALRAPLPLAPAAGVLRGAPAAGWLRCATNMQHAVVCAAELHRSPQLSCAAARRAARRWPPRRLRAAPLFGTQQASEIGCSAQGCTGAARLRAVSTRARRARSVKRNLLPPCWELGPHSAPAADERCCARCRGALGAALAAPWASFAPARCAAPCFLFAPRSPRFWVRDRRRADLPGAWALLRWRLTSSEAATAVVRGRAGGGDEASAVLEAGAAGSAPASQRTAHGAAAPRRCQHAAGARTRTSAARSSACRTCRTSGAAG